MPPRAETCEVLRNPIAVVDYARAVALVKEWTATEAVFAVEAANTHVVSLARHEPAFQAALEKFDLLLPDGMPLVWCINRLLPAARRLSDRVYGPTFMLRCLEATSGDNGSKHFLLGGTTELLAELSARLRSRIPGLQITGMYAPPFGKWSDEEDEKIINAIATSGARYIWVGLGCPKQERWIARMKERLPHGVYFAVGAAFAFHAGQVKQAPPWLQDRGLEWIYRLLTEPRRLATRYLRFNTLFLFYLVKDSLIQRRGFKR